ncbi:MAG: adenylate kinase [Patescibacteria group bacterium]|nr:MAG: adenylate kinase [Patescibacteria group bacterium]
MKILLIGPIGSGKGTQGEMLSEYLHLPLISVGQVLRDLSPDHPWFGEINKAMLAGNPAPQDKVASLLKEIVAGKEFERGYIMDGWGRALEDWQYFDPDYDKVIVINVSPETSVSRLSTRRTCESCGAVYNIVSKPPKVEGVCDRCGGVLKQREDDTEEAVKRRLEIYNNETVKTIDRFRSEGKLIEVDGEGTAEEVFEDIKKHFVK